MRHAISLFAILLLVLPGCGKKDDSDKGVRGFTPPPTKIRFFNGTKKNMVVKKDKGVRFNVKDNAGNMDQHGDDEATLADDVTIKPGKKSGDLAIVVPTHRKRNGVKDSSANVDVDYPYKTITYWITADVGGTTLVASFSVPAGGDVEDQTLDVKVQPDGAQTTMWVTAHYIDGQGKTHDANASVTK